MVVSTSQFRELTAPSEYLRALKRLVRAPHNNRLEGAAYLTLAPDYVANGRTATVSAVLRTNQTLAHGLPTVSRNGKLELLSPSETAERENTFVVELGGSFATHCLTLERAPNGPLLTVEAARPVRFCAVPGSPCDAYVAYPTSDRQARHRSRLGWRIYRVNVKDLAKVVALHNEPAMRSQSAKPEPRFAKLAA